MYMYMYVHVHVVHNVHECLAHVHVQTKGQQIHVITYTVAIHTCTM